MFRKVLFLWSNMPSFSFIGYTLTELFRKTGNWRQIYKQTSSTFYTSNGVLRRKNYQHVITRLRNSNSCLITIFFKKNTEAATGDVLLKKCVLKNFANSPEKHRFPVKDFFNKFLDLQPASFLKRDSITSASLWSLENF